MKKPKIIYEFKRLTDAGLEGRALAVAAGMNNNPFFVTPDPTLEELVNVTGQYSAALIAAQHRDRLKSSEKNDVCLNLEILLTNLANYVTAVAKGSRTVLISSGFAVSSDNTVTVPADSIQNFSVKQGNSSGALVLSADRLPGNNTYTFYYAIVDEANMVWEHAVSNNKSRVELTGLQAGKTYIFYLKVVCAKDKFLVTDTITKIVF